MIRRPLHTRITPLQNNRIPTIQHQLDIPLQHNAIIQTRRTMHRRYDAWSHVYDSEDRTAVDYEARWRGEEGRVGGYVGCGGEVGGEGVGGVAEEEVGFFSGGGPCCLGGDFVGEDGFSGGVVGGDVAVEAGEGT